MADERELFLTGRDLELLQRDIEAQRHAISHFEAERAVAAQGADAAAAEEADYRLFQARRYLEELEADLAAVAQSESEAKREIFVPVSPPRESSMKSAAGLAVVVGHAANADGAVGLVPPFPGTMRSEFPWNSDLAKMIKEELTGRGARCEIFFREVGGQAGVIAAYRKVVEWGPQAAVELHFNSVDGGTARGTETLYEFSGSRAWAEILQNSMVSLYGHAGKVTESGSKLDRGLLLASKNRRGLASLNKFDPSALIEPFFGNNTVDAGLGTNLKRELAKSIADAFVKLTGTAAGTAVSSAPSTPSPAPVSPVAPAQPVFAVPVWERLRAFYAGAQIEFPVLKDISYAQWGLESTHGTSKLAREFMNFGGLKYRPVLSDICQPGDYVDSGGRKDKYCKFLTFENFMKGYWRRFDDIPNYKGWRQHTASGDEFINFIGDIYAPPSENTNYRTKVRKVYDDYKRKGWLPSQWVASAPVTVSTAPASSEPASSGGGAGTGAVQPGTTSSMPVPGDGTSHASTATGGATAGTTPTAPTMPAPPPAAVTAAALVSAVKSAAPAGTEHFRRLVELYARMDGQLPHLKPVTIAQWALESDWGRSLLAAAHYNFAAMKWLDGMAGLAASVDYKRPLGGVEPYCRFLTLEHFLRGYWARLDCDPRFAGWQQNTATAKAFADFVLPKWNVADPAYTRKVVDILNRFKLPEPSSPVVADAAPAVPSKPAEPPPTKPADVPTSKPTMSAVPATVNLDGFILEVVRKHTEYRSGKGYARTVAEYQAYFNRQAIPGLGGFCYERQGIGDNTSTGTASHRRIAAGSYPIYTQAGQKYVTYNYTSGTSYPKPGLLVGNTGYRQGIVFHPGSGYLASIGCLNPSRPLVGPGDNLDFAESRGRVITLIDTMRQKLGDRFPSANGKLIKDAWLVVKGEPPNVDSQTDRMRKALRESVFSSNDGGREAAMETSLLGAPEGYLLVASTLIGAVAGETVSVKLFEAIAAGRNDLKDLRSQDGENLWPAWAQGWQSARSSADPDESARASTELLDIMRRLMAAGVDLNDSVGPRTPLTSAAAANLWEAVARLHEAGGEIDRRDKLGDTPLTAAAYAGAVETVEYLLGSGADPQLKTGAPIELPEGMYEGALEVERCPAGSTALECATAGRPLDPNDSRQARYNIIEGLLGR